MNFEDLTNATKAGIIKMKKEFERTEKERQNKKIMKELGFETEREMTLNTRVLDAERILSRIEYHLWSFREFDMKRIEDEELRNRMTMCIEHMLDLVTMYVMDYDPKYMVNLTTRERVYYDEDNKKHGKGGN